MQEEMRTDRCLKKSHGADPGIALPFSVVFMVALIGFAGVAIFTGLQAYFMGELQKTATTAAMAGAAAYYSEVGGDGRPAPNPGKATQYATEAFNNIKNASGALTNYKTELVSVSTNDSTDSVTVNLTGEVPTPFLALVGLSSIKMSASGTAAAMKHVPTNFTGPIVITPPTTMDTTLELVFPLVDGPGTDLYVEQIQQRGYTVLACNDSECYDLIKGATPFGDSRIVNRNGVEYIYGTAFIDLEKAGVRKASKLKFVDDGVYNALIGGDQYIDTQPVPTIISRVMLFGFAGACPKADYCSPPHGFERVE